MCLGFQRRMGKLGVNSVSGDEAARGIVRQGSSRPHHQLVDASAAPLQKGMNWGGRLHEVHGYWWGSPENKNKRVRCVPGRDGSSLPI